MGQVYVFLWSDFGEFPSTNVHATIEGAIEDALGMLRQWFADEIEAGEVGDTYSELARFYVESGGQQNEFDFMWSIRTEPVLS